MHHTTASILFTLSAALNFFPMTLGIRSPSSDMGANVSAQRVAIRISVTEARANHTTAQELSSLR